jgi:hypothetical protein
MRGNRHMATIFLYRELIERALEVSGERTNKAVDWQCRLSAVRERTIAQIRFLVGGA